MSGLCVLESQDGYIPALGILVSYQGIHCGSKYAKKDVSRQKAGTEAFNIAPGHNIT